MSSTDSLPEESTPSQPQETQTPQTLSEGESRLADELEMGEGLRRLLRMIGLQSVDRNLRTEDQAVAADIAAWQGELTPGGGSGRSDHAPIGGDDEMRIMAARDVILNRPTDSSAPAAVPTTTTPAQPSMSKAALIAAILGAGAIGGGIPALYQYLNPPEVEVKQDSYDLELLPPVEPREQETP